MRRYGTIVRSFVASVAFLFAAVASSKPTQACIGPHNRFFPACTIPAPQDTERTSVIYANSGKAPSSTLGDANGVTEVVDIEIGPSDKPHYIVLSSGKPIIWRFSGRLDLVSRVIVLGSQYGGNTKFGIIGIPRNSIITPDANVSAVDDLPWTTCTSKYYACEASAYFNIPEADRMKVLGPAPARKYPVDQFVESLQATTVRIPDDGWIEAEDRNRFHMHADGLAYFDGPARGRYEPFAPGR
jgi:hypothetical protein